MKYAWIEACNLPLKTVLIDDDKKFITRMAKRLQSKNIICQAYDTPEVGLKYCEQIHQPLTVFRDCFKNLRHGEIDREKITDYLVNIDLPLLSQTLYAPARFDHAAIVIIDYAMKGMNGIELARKLRKISPLIKIIMLTGQAKDNIGIQGWTEGILDMFINKDTENLHDYLAKIIIASQKQYFQALSHPLVELLSLNNDFCLMNTTFIDFFENLKKEKGFIEHYLLNDKGDFIFLNFQGKPAFLAVYTDEHLKEQLDDALIQEEVPEKVKNALKLKEAALFFYPLEKAPADTQWGRYLHPIQKIPHTPYYYALIEDLSPYDFPAKKIKSYEQFLKENSED